MRLSRMTFSGYRRFLHKNTLKTGSKLTVLVGPNEAGKSSILALLSKMKEGEDWAIHDRHKYPEDAKISAELVYDLSSEDHEEIGSDTPKQYVVRKNDEGELSHELIPKVARSKSHRAGFMTKLSRAAKNSFLVKVMDDEELDHNALVRLSMKLDVDQETISQNDLALLEEVSSALSNNNTDSAPKYVRDFAAEIQRFLLVERAPHPNDTALKIADSKEPAFVEFSQDDREIQPTYNLSHFEHENPKSSVEPSKALRNLCEVSGLDLRALKASFTANRTDRVQSMIDSANIRLRDIFAETWSQSDVALQFSWQRPNLEIMVLTEEDQSRQFSPLADRSDGFKQYAALVAFIIRQNARTPILLIDEAEQHLHYDAQADLIQTLTERNLASQVIYTTHSAGCLPEDLGVGVRLVKPESTEKGFSVSRVENNFWSNDALGFSPLLYGMGAQTLAFFPIRRALVCEGPTEMILVPTILRQVNNTEHNGFQVVPGLATHSKTEIRRFATQGENVAYLLDRDGAGRTYQKELIGAGVCKKRVFFVADKDNSAVTVEDWIEDAVFTSAVRTYLERYYPQPTKVADDLFFGDGKAAKLRTLESSEFKFSKPALAYIILEQAETASGLQIFNPRHKKYVSKLAKLIIQSFEPG